MKNQKQRKQIRRWIAVGSIVVLATMLFSLPVFAANEATATFTNLIDFFVVVVRMVGVAIFLYGILNVGVTISSHDNAQRAQGFLSIAGGVLIFFGKEIMTAIGMVF